MARAEFTMNFAAQRPADSEFRTDIQWWYGGDPLANLTDRNNQTRFLIDPTDPDLSTLGHRPEIVQDANGNVYYHMITGDLADGFIQEAYVQMNVGGSYGNTGEPANAESASGGTGLYIPRTANVNTLDLGNGYDPLDMDANARAQNVVSGNGTGNPTRVTIRQLINDGEIMMEFLKDKYEYKPKITQMIVAADMLSLFDIDMRAVKYQGAGEQMTTDSPIFNTLQLYGEDLNAVAANFDMATDTDQSTVTGGKYEYVDGAGFGGSEGTYNYSSGTFNHEAQGWAELFDVNVFNPWSFEEAKPENNP